MASSFSGLISAGVFAGLDGVRGLAGWRWLFIIQGAVTIAAAVVACKSAVLFQFALMEHISRISTRLVKYHC